MHIGVPLFLLRPQRMATIAAHAEALGFESVWLPEHVVFPPEIRSRYPYSETGAPVRTDMPLLDPLVLLAHVAAKTERIRLGTNVYLPALRHPIVSARMIVTLDVLSRGRLSLGVGAGWLEEEFTALGVDFASRGARLRECVRAWRVLWQEKTPSFSGRFFSFGPVMFEPKPMQRPGPPILFGGETEAALERAAELGDGWYGVRHTPESARTQVERLRALLAKRGRSIENFEITVSAGPIDRKEADLFAAVGVTRLVVLPWRHDREAEAALEALAQQLGLCPS
ncbi:MAG: LLM class F420-dependent oxidoreductase [Candidatus Binatia bacterium]|nr:LLM class F420-dependent oxidoreductase [Candidatus Binatia bacterium]